MTKKETIDCKKEFRARLEKAYGFAPSMDSIILLEAGSSADRGGKNKIWGHIYASINNKHFYCTDKVGVGYVRKVDKDGFRIEGQEPIVI